MVQLNLLPDVKIDFINAKRKKRFVMMVALFVIAVSVGLFVIMFGFVYGVQKKHSDDLNNDITKGINTIKSTPEIDKILTVQNQLGIINSKHEEKPAASRTLPMIATLLPSDTKLTQLDVDFAENTISIGGTAPDVPAVNKIVDTFKFANYQTKADQSDKAFSEVVLGSYAMSEENNEITFSIKMKYNPIIFDNKEEVSVFVPGIVSTRSSTEKPNIQFVEKGTGQ